MLLYLLHSTMILASVNIDNDDILSYSFLLLNLWPSPISSINYIPFYLMPIRHQQGIVNENGQYKLNNWRK